MKINNLNSKDNKTLLKLVRNNLKNSVLFYLSDNFIKFSFFREILKNRSFFSLIAKDKGEPLGIIIIKKKLGVFSNNLYVKILIDALMSTFTRDLSIFLKLLNIKFSKRKIVKKFKINNFDCAEIIYIAVENKHRNKGIGKKLISKASKILSKKHKFLITSSENSKQVIKFYKANNFINIGYETRFKKKNILMLKNL